MSTKRMVRFLVIAASAVASEHCARSQFYAPDTEYHDMVQRVFPVELARVLAWRANLSGKAIAEIACRVETDGAGKTTWSIDWLDGGKTKVASQEVSYDAGALLSGAEFYRQIAKQMMAEPTLSVAAGKKIPADAVAGRFWRGADLAGASRADSIAKAFDLDPSGDPAGTAGLLAHAALPSMAGSMTIDGLLLARAAAWLCIAECCCDGARREDTWAPILFLASREEASTHCGAPAAGGAASPSAALWSLLATRPLARDCFAFAADPANRGCAAGALMYGAQMTGSGKALAEALVMIFGQEGDSLFALHDYGPFLARFSDVGGGRLLEGEWPMLSRKAFVACARVIKPGPGDYTGYTGALAEAEKQWPERDVEDASLVGLEQCAPLLKLGLAEANGPLIPVATVTARDLLGFGWEMAGCQMGARWFFVERRWGVHDLSAEIARGTYAQDLQMAVFFVRWPPNFAKGDQKIWDMEQNHLTDFARMQTIDASVAWMGARDVFAPERTGQASLFARRCWLRPHALWEQSSALYYSGVSAEMLPHIRRSIQEGGRRMESAALEWLIDGLHPPSGESQTLQIEIARGMKESTKLQLKATRDDRSSLSRLEWAQAEEKIFWTRPGSDLPFANIFLNYIWAGAFEAAKRFHAQAAPLIDDTVALSNSMGRYRIALALAENDRAGLPALLAQGRSASYLDMTADIVAAAAQGDYKGVEQGVDEAIERYDANRDDAMLQGLKGFLPLIPALKDPADPRRAQALDYFANSDQWPALQWFLIKNFALPVEDAVRFLGNGKGHPPRNLMCLYLRGDKEGFERVYAQWEQADRKGTEDHGGMAFVLVSYLRKDLLKAPEPQPQPDLRPPDAKSLTQIVAEKVAQSRRAVLSGELAEIKDADGLWAHFAALKSALERSRGDESDLRNTIERTGAAAEEFAGRYPDDPRRWEARLLLAQTARLSAALRGERADIGSVERDLRAISEAQAAGDPVRAEARITLFGLHLAQASAPGGAPQALRAELDSFARDYPQHPQLAKARLGYANAIMASDSDGARALVRLVASGSDAEAALEARAIERRLDLRTRPIEMKFSAIDGRKVDLAALRGRVVLIDFWATWCAPCMASVPELIDLDRKYRERGLVIIGISFDQKKQALEQTLKARGITWSQYFDGKGFSNDISSPYRIDSIPRAWLVNKRGFVVNLDAEMGEDLTAEIEKLLAE